MNEQMPHTLATTAATARAVVEHMILLASSAESDQWLAKYVAVQKALAEERFVDAVREHSQLVDYRIETKGVSSRDMERMFRTAMNNLARDLKLPNSGRVEIQLDDLPTAIDERGTIAEAEKRSMNEWVRSFKRDPLDTDPRFAEILAAADRQAESELECHPINGGLGFCHVYWQRKKAILKHTYGLEWHTPAELNVDAIFD